MLDFLPVALATLDTAAPQGTGWTHEEKLDGYRIEAIVDDRATPRVRLFSRNAKEWTHRFPDIVAALDALPVTAAVLDGEVIASGANNAGAFQRLQQLLDQGEVRQVRYVIFDLLHVDGNDLRSAALAERQELLTELLRYRLPRSAIRGVKRFSLRKGDPLLQACAAGLEGVVSKRLDGRYIAGRHRSWIKSKCSRRQEFVIVGYTDPQGSRLGFGALLLGYYEGDTLRFAGKVGTGFNTALLNTLFARLQLLTLVAPPLPASRALPRSGVHWVRPELVAEIAFTEWTTDGLLRHPVYRGLREDKPARQVKREEPS